VVIYICKLKDSVIKLVLKNTYQYYYHLQLENKVLDNNAAYQEVLEDTSSSSSPPRFEYGDTDDLAERLRDPESTALLSQILTQLTKRKRKTSERSECDCDCEDRSAKKRRNGNLVNIYIGNGTLYNSTGEILMLVSFSNYDLVKQDTCIVQKHLFPAA
jgi:hypothetical protein